MRTADLGWQCPLMALSGHRDGHCSGQLLTDAVDKVGGVTGLVPLAAARLRWFLPFIRTPVVVAGLQRCYGTPLAPTLTQLTRPRGLAAATPIAAPLS